MFSSSSPVTFATTKLSYPLFDAEFDPYSRGYLVVAGGGGENRTGIPNKISLLDVSSRTSIFEVGDTSLSIDEDSPQSIASLATKGGLITFVGASSSIADQQGGKNEHFCSYEMEFPPRKRVKTDGDSSVASVLEQKSETRIRLTARTSLFKPPKPSHSKVYQRLMRLSPVNTRQVAARRIGAIATADAAENELVVFDATTSAPSASSVLGRIATSVEVEDLDLYDHTKGSFSLAYCTNHDVFVYAISQVFANKMDNPLTPSTTAVFSVTKHGSSRPVIRSIRWMSPLHILLLQNMAQSGGPQLQVLRIDNGKGLVIQRYNLSRSIKRAVRLDVCRLDKDPVTGECQIVIAVAGQDKSIHILTCNHRPSEIKISDQITKLTSFIVLDTSRQHPQSISKIAFANFFPPLPSDSSTMSVATDTQYIQLASISLGYTVSVESLALTTIPTSPSSTPNLTEQRINPSVRWVLSKNHFNFLQFGCIAAAGLAILLAIILLSNQRRSIYYALASSPAGVVMPHVTEGVASLGVTPSVSEAIFEVSKASIGTDQHSGHTVSDLFQVNRRHLVKDKSSSDESREPAKAIHVILGSENPYGSALSASLHDDPERLRRNGAKRFDELEQHEKEIWKKRLSDAGHWSVEEGETVLKSVLFSQWADVVGGAVRDAVLQR